MGEHINVNPQRLDDYSKSLKDGTVASMNDCFNMIQNRCTFGGWESNAKNNFSDAMLSLKQASDLLISCIEGYATQVEGFSNQYRLAEKLNVSEVSIFG